MSSDRERQRDRDLVQRAQDAWFGIEISVLIGAVYSYFYDSTAAEYWLGDDFIWIYFGALAVLAHHFVFLNSLKRRISEGSW